MCRQSLELWTQEGAEVNDAWSNVAFSIISRVKLVAKFSDRVFRIQHAKNKCSVFAIVLFVRLFSCSRCGFRILVPDVSTVRK